MCCRAAGSLRTGALCPQGSSLCHEVAVITWHGWKHTDPRARQFSCSAAVLRLGALLLAPRYTMPPLEASAVSCFGFEVGFQLLSVLSAGFSHFY